jgi:hypothetical protein
LMVGGHHITRGNESDVSPSVYLPSRLPSF